MFTDLESIATVTMCICFVMSAKMMRTLGWQEVHKIFIQHRPNYATTKYAGMVFLFSIIAQVKQKLQLQNNLISTAGYRFYTYKVRCYLSSLICSTSLGIFHLTFTGV